MEDAFLTLQEAKSASIMKSFSKMIPQACTLSFPPYW